MVIGVEQEETVEALRLEGVDSLESCSSRVRYFTGDGTDHANERCHGKDKEQMNGMKMKINFVSRPNI